MIAFLQQHFCELVHITVFTWAFLNDLTDHSTHRLFAWQQKTLWSAVFPCALNLDPHIFGALQLQLCISPTDTCSCRRFPLAHSPVLHRTDMLLIRCACECWDGRVKNTTFWKPF